MRAIRWNILPGVAGVGLLTAGGLLVAWAALTPLAGPADPSDAGPAGIALTSRTRDALTLASFAPAWSLDLRRPLADAPAGSADAAQSAGEILPVRLVGTIVDPVRPRGIFLTTRGQMELRAVGETTGGAEVLGIDERSATLSIAGKPVTLEIEKTEIPVPGGSDPGRPPSARSQPDPVEAIVR